MEENNIYYFYHKDWNGSCSLINNKIIRIDYPDETGTYNINNNKIFIKWDKWNDEIFCLFEKNSYLLEEIYNKKYIHFYIIDKEENYYIILNKNNNIFYQLFNNHIIGIYTIFNQYITLEINNIIKEYKLFNNKNYYLNDNTIFFEIIINDNNIKKIYLFDKIKKKFYDKSNKIIIKKDNLIKDQLNKYNDINKNNHISENNDINKEINNIIQKQLIKDEFIKTEFNQDELIKTEFNQDELIKTEFNQDELIKTEFNQDELIKTEFNQDELIKTEFNQDELIKNEFNQDELIKDELIKDELIKDELIKDNILENKLENQIKYELEKNNELNINFPLNLSIGNYELIDNSILMNWNNGIKKIFYSNTYSSNYSNKTYKNINIIKPNIIKIDNKIIFSNISLCKNKIILTSLYYQNEPIDFKNIYFKIYQNKKNYNNDLINNDLVNNDLINNDLINNNLIHDGKNKNLENIHIINKYIYENNDYEASSSIILELENIYNDLLLYIQYKKNNFKIYLKQLNIPEYNIYAMTLFKDDYYLLSRYLKYYNALGVNLFYIYYNDLLNEQLLEYLISIVKNNDYIIYIIEWNYEYWIKSSYTPNLKQHSAQTMAINDSLHILKNYGNYILYNDLDEYIILNNNKTFIDIINENNDIDIFIFKNRFCKMGLNLIKYKDFDDEFDLNKIIKGNYWDTYREKNLIKIKNINVMGVHSYFEKFSLNNISTNIEGEFYHIINFEEKYRENLMTEYIR
jgi:hypothetical protein